MQPHTKVGLVFKCGLRTVPLIFLTLTITNFHAVFLDTTTLLSSVAVCGWEEILLLRAENARGVYYC